MVDNDKGILHIEFRSPNEWAYSLQCQNIAAQQLWAVIPALSKLADELYERQLEQARAARQAQASVREETEQTEIASIVKSFGKDN